jgi:hypothetical protein
LTHLQKLAAPVAQPRADRERARQRRAGPRTRRR